MQSRQEFEREGQAGAWGDAAASPATGEERPLRLRDAIRALLACAWHTTALIVRGRLHQPMSNVGRCISFADGTFAQVYRETVIDRKSVQQPAVLVVCFRLRGIRAGWQHALFRMESELNTVLFAGFPGLVSKLWLRHDQNHLYRGLYQWDDPVLAVAYVRALWWVLVLVSEPGSIHYAVLPGLDRDKVIADPSSVDTLETAPGGWWRPAGEGPAGAGAQTLDA